MSEHTAAAYGLSVEPAPIIPVRGERCTLWRAPLSAWKSKTKLRGFGALGPDVEFPAFGSLRESTVVLRHNGQRLEPMQDYVIDANWAALAIAQGSALEDGAEVEVDYSYSLRRLDAWVEQPDGSRVIRAGVPDLTVPQPPCVEADERHIANVFADYGQTADTAELYWILTQDPAEPTLTRSGRLPRTVTKLKAGEPVRIVCWGDSVTVGGDVSAPELAYPRVFEKRLRERYPQARITVEPIAVGGSESRNWIEPDKYQHPTRQHECRWERVVEAKPDVVTIEFVNDDRFPTCEFRPRYDEILRRLSKIGAEVVLITPHFTAPGWMSFRTNRDAEVRPYVFDLLALAAERCLAVADVSARWASLWKRGLPYSTLLKNGVNHPDDRGHALFADELLKCFL